MAQQVFLRQISVKRLLICNSNSGKLKQPGKNGQLLITRYKMLQQVPNVFSGYVFPNHYLVV